MNDAIVQVPETFDMPAANRLGRVLESKDAPFVTLDFSHVRELYAFALAALLSHLLRSPRPTRVRVWGLSHHHHRLLQYLGVNIERLMTPLDSGPMPAELGESIEAS